MLWTLNCSGGGKCAVNTKWHECYRSLGSNVLLWLELAVDCWHVRNYKFRCWCLCVRVCACVRVTSGNKTSFFFVCFKLYRLLFLGWESGYGNRRGCAAKITVRGRNSVAPLVRNTAERLDYLNWFGPRNFDKSDCPDNQTCVRVLSQITVIDLGNNL